jgi:PHD/YefM family antitoxin component YafN of YafNO toxin-antitoxin module
MRTLSASEIKRRGIVAVEGMLHEGPVHIIKNNKLKCVVLSEKDYENLILRAKPKKGLGLSHMLEKPATGTMSRRDINQRIEKMRNEWK